LCALFATSAVALVAFGAAAGGPAGRGAAISTDCAPAGRGLQLNGMLEDLLQRRPYNAAVDFVDANVARGLGQKVAFIDPARTLTYGELQARTYQFAAALRSLGLRQ